MTKRKWAAVGCTVATLVGIASMYYHAPLAWVGPVLGGCLLGVASDETMGTW